MTTYKINLCILFKKLHYLLNGLFSCHVISWIWIVSNMFGVKHFLCCIIWSKFQSFETYWSFKHGVFWLILFGTKSYSKKKKKNLKINYWTKRAGCLLQKVTGCDIKLGNSLSNKLGIRLPIIISRSLTKINVFFIRILSIFNTYTGEGRKIFKKNL